MRARESALAFFKEANADPARPYLVVRVNSLGSGLTDADLDAVRRRPDAIMLPKAEGGASVVHTDAKLGEVREAANGLPDGHIKIIPSPPRPLRRSLSPALMPARARGFPR